VIANRTYEILWVRAVPRTVVGSFAITNSSSPRLRSLVHALGLIDRKKGAVQKEIELPLNKTE